jgi:hypothetical protein
MLAAIVWWNRSIRGRVPALTDRSGRSDQRIAPEREGAKQTNLGSRKVATRWLDSWRKGKNAK